MKTFSRTHLPEVVKYNGEEYRNDAYSSGALSAGSIRKLSTIVSYNKLLGKKTILVEVLSSRLKGKTDAHNRPYKPTKWVFTNK